MWSRGPACAHYTTFFRFRLIINTTNVDKIFTTFAQKIFIYYLCKRENPVRNGYGVKLMFN